MPLSVKGFEFGGGISSCVFLTGVPYAGHGAPVVLLFLLGGPENRENSHSKLLV